MQSTSDRNHKAVLSALTLLVLGSITCTFRFDNAAEDEYLKGRQFALQGKDEQSLKALGNSIRLDPKYAPAHLERARVLNRLSRFKEALEECNLSIALDPK